MITPTSPDQLLTAAVAGALILIAGGGYALATALHRLGFKGPWRLLGRLSYILLAVAVATLAVTLHFSGAWLLLAAVMLLGYLAAPLAIWHLCLATHGRPARGQAPEDLP